MEARILLVEDDLHVVELVKACLEPEGFSLEVANDGDGGLRQALRGEHDLLILDIMLPGKDGWEILRELGSSGQKAPRMPIIMLTAKGAEVDRVLGLELGADDYLVKPFSPRELLARIKALLRRIEETREDSGVRVSLKDLEIDPSGYTVTLAGRPLELTPREFELLHFMAIHQGQVLSRDQILDSVWGIDYPGTTRTVDEHIKRLRQKLGREPRAPVSIATVWGVGYRLEVSRQTEGA